MYLIDTIEEVIRIEPSRLSESLEKVCMELAKNAFEGKYVGNNNIVVLVLDTKLKGEGRIVHGDASVYQRVELKALLFHIDVNEVIEGTVVNIHKFGAFVNLGPLDGLLHISQIIDSHIDVDETNQRLIAREAKKDLRVGNKVRVRLVSVSINERNPKESKIGLTMRQLGLGRFEWIEEQLKKSKETKESKKEK